MSPAYRDAPPQFSYGGQRGGGSIADMIMHGGNVQAEAALRAGQGWADTFSGLGQTVASGLQQRHQAKQMAKRDAAWVSFIGSGEWAADPKQAFAETVRIWGPQEGPRQFQALTAVSQLSGGKRDPEKDRAALGMVGSAMSKMGPQGRAALWPQAVTLARAAMPELDLPEQYDQQVWTEVVEPMLGAMQPQQAPVKVGPGETLVDPRTGEARFQAPPEQKAAEPRVVGRSLVGPDGKVIYRDPEAPRQAEPRRPVQVETVGPDGKPVTMFVDPQAGQSFAKPTGAGRPATGQQRKALNFFNRGREAQEIATALETGDKISPTALKYMPDLMNFAHNSEDQSYLQAQRAFTEARLRKESGAAVPSHEYENDAKTYFAQPGDDKKTIEQKRRSRNSVLAGIAFESGDALREFYGDEAEGMVEEYKRLSQRDGAPRGGQRGGGDVARPKSKADYDALQSGQTFIAPDGTLRVKP